MNSNNENSKYNEQEKANPEQKVGMPETPRPEDQNAGVPKTPQLEGQEKNASPPANKTKSEVERQSAVNSVLLMLRGWWHSLTWQKIVAISLAFTVCIVIAVFFLVRHHKRLVAGDIANKTAAQKADEKVVIKVFYPSPGGLVPEEKQVEPSEIQTRIVESAVLEYLKGPSAGTTLYVPEGTQLLGLYQGSDGIIYMDFSHEFRSNFQGDAYSEFLLLRGLYESVMSNAKGISGLKILIDGKEVDTIGGHISLEGTLGSAVSSTILERDAGK